MQQPSAREVLRARKGLAPLVVVASFVVLGALGLMAAEPVSPARGYTVGPPSPALICMMATIAATGALEARLAPPEGASVQAGTSVTFSGYSRAPVTFAVASSPALLSTPDIDGGPGAVQPENAYTFTSTKANTTPGTVYWDASFSSTRVSPNARVCRRRPMPRSHAR